MFKRKRFASILEEVFELLGGRLGGILEASWGRLGGVLERLGRVLKRLGAENSVFEFSYVTRGPGTQLCLAAGK